MRVELQLKGSSELDIMQFDKIATQQLEQIDREIIIELDKLIQEQQIELRLAGVPNIYSTNKPEEIALQLLLLHPYRGNAAIQKAEALEVIKETVIAPNYN